MSELEMVRQVASDRLIYMRLMEKCINDMDMALLSLKRDVAEVSQQVASRNEDLTLEESDEEKSDD